MGSASASATNVMMMMMMNNLVSHHSKPLSLLPSHFPTSHKPIVARRGIPRHHLTSPSPSPSQPLTLHCDKNCSAQVFEETPVSKHVFHGTKDPMEEILESLYKNSLPCLIALVPFLDDAKKAFAIGGEYGLVEGRSASLIHPIVMGVLFVFTLWTGYLGWQWRRVRTIQDEITQLKKQVKPQPVAAGEGSSSPPPPPSPIEAQIQQLTEERKQLLKGSYREKHFNAGSILLAFGVFEAIGGCLNTYLRTGKLFPGPHLFAGAGIMVLWAWAAALVPAMQKGNETARSLHIALNAINVLLFIWQIPTGFEIVLKVFEFTKWP